MKPGVLRCCILFPICAKTHLRASAIPKNSPDPIKGERKGFGREGETGIGGEGMEMKEEE
jgi:hypothetical protein